MNSMETLITRQINRWNNMAQLLNARAQPAHEATQTSEEFAARHPAICISRDLGAGARTVAAYLCEQLGYELIGKSIIDELADDLHVQRQLIETLDERARYGLDVIVDSYLRGGREIDNMDYFRSLVRMVRTLGLKGGVIILGRGGSFILKEKAGVNVLITAPRESRVRRLMDYLAVDEDKAFRLIEESDRERREFIKLHFNAGSHDPLHYDLCLNTEKVAAGQAAKMILHLLELRGHTIESLRMPAVHMAG